MYKVLVIASGSKLDVPQEVQNLQLIDGLDVDIISGTDATLGRISLYASQNSYHTIYIVCHSDGAKFILDNDVFISREYLAKIAKLSDVTLVYANACGTVYFGQYLVDNGVPVAITNSVQPADNRKGVMEIYDHDALMNGLMFFRKLIKFEGDVEAAHKATKNDDGALSIHSNGGLAKRLMAPVLDEISIVRSEGIKRGIDTCKRLKIGAIIIAISGIITVATLLLVLVK